MYQKFYNLTKEPFHITSDPQFLYLSESHKQALASMVYGIEKRKGFVAITGGVGTGKTTVVRAYLDRAKSADLKVIYLFQANMTFRELVRIIYREFDLEFATDNLVEMVNGLHLALIELYRQGKTVVIIIDEAQNMPVETLENLRMLSNLETPTEKLIQIVLVGQTELDELLEKHELRQLKQRIAIRSRILPLNEEDSRAYIKHRLSVAGVDNSSIFDKGALDIIVREADGVPRRLNILCDNALITGFGYQKNPVTAGIAKEVVADFRSENKKETHSPGRKVGLFIALGVVAAVLIVLLLLPYKEEILTDLRGIGHTDITKPQPMPPPASPSADIKPQSAPSTYWAPETRLPTGTSLFPAPETKPQAGDSAPAVSAPVHQKSEANHQKGAESQNGVKPGYKTRVVKHGETLTNLIREVYGVSAKSVPDDSLIKMVRQRNPAISNPDLIKAGSVIQFPDLPRGQR